ncbi:MAG TPA: hypothetical protein VGN07_06845 [Steroidobacteraceae bacterium]|jgi:hypothetical protein
MNVQRRSFVAAASATAVLALAGGLSSAGPAGSKLDALLARVLQALNHPAPGKPAGVLAGVDSLLARVLNISLGELDDYAQMPNATLRRRIQDNIALDYGQRHLRVIDGWWLSNTEADCMELIERSYPFSNA